MSKARFLEKRRSATPPIWPGECILAVVALVIVVVAYLWVSTDDYAQQERLAQPTLHKQAQAAPKVGT